MAENKVVITTEVNAQPAVNSLKELKAELKAAQAAALNGDGKAAKRVAELKDKLDDLKDATKTLQGSGVEKVSSSFNLLADGFKNFDFDKIKTGFAGVGKAMSAVPALLIAEGIMYLVQNFDELSKGSGLLAQALRFVGDVIDTIKDGLYALTDAIGLTNSALDAMGDFATKKSEMMKNALSDQIAEFDRQAAVAKAAGKSTIEIEENKQKAIIETNKMLINQILDLKKAGAELTDEQYKQLKTSTDAIRNAQAQLTIISSEEETKRNKEKLDAAKKFAEDKKKQDAEMAKNKEANEKALGDAEYEQWKANYLKQKKEEEEAEAAKIKQQQDNEAFMQGYYQRENARIAAKVAAEEAAAEREKQLEIEKQKARLETAQNATTALQGISDLAFTIRMAQVKKGSAEEEKVARRQFQINKALQLSTAVINGAQSILAITSVPDFTLGVQTAIRIAGQVALTAATIAKIATTKFEPSGGGGGDTGGSLPSLGGGGAAAPTSAAPTTAAPPSPPTTGLDEQGNVIGRQNVVKAVVVETDITKSQQRIERYNNESSF